MKIMTSCASGSWLAARVVRALSIAAANTVVPPAWMQLIVDTSAEPGTRGDVADVL